MITYRNFNSAIVDTRVQFVRTNELVHPTRWQGIDVSKMPEMATHEVLDHSFCVQMSKAYEKLDMLRNDVRPDLPWCDDHFAERVSGTPLNPPPSEAWWPHSPGGNDQFKDHTGIFSHTYPERYWPRYAGMNGVGNGNYGIRFRYGDLGDLVKLLAMEPLTRQAYLPVWFPEDTGIAHSDRKPCTLGYHFIMRDGECHITYYIRSCDIKRHFRNDIYMTARLLIWVIEQCRQLNVVWNDIEPGRFNMHITSLHCFRNDYREIAA